MSKYELIIYWSKQDKAFVVEVPELPGCMADGGTYEEALAKAQDTSLDEDARLTALDDLEMVRVALLTLPTLPHYAPQFVENIDNANGMCVSA